MMDQTAKNVRSIIEPYEKRIKVLEETLRAKDFEIAVLKQKLINLNNGQKINQEIPNNNNEIKKINVKFIDDKNNEKTLKCKPTEKTKKVFENYLNNSLFEIRNINFIYGNYLMNPILTLEQNGIVNNSIILAEPKKLMSLVFEDGLSFCIGFNYEENTPVGLAFIYYLIERKT